MECELHGRTTHLRRSDRHCDSVVDEQNQKLVLNINVAIDYRLSHDMQRPDCWVGQPGAGRQWLGVRYAGQSWSGERGACRDHFQSCIEDYWSGALKLRSVYNPQSELTCVVSLSFVPLSDASVHLRVLALNRPNYDSHARSVSPSWGSPSVDTAELAFRSACNLGGLGPRDEIDMYLAWHGPGGWDHDQNSTPPWVFQTSQGPMALRQNTVAHEFGHYLGLPHTCSGRGTGVGWCGGNVPGASPYCVGDEPYLMDSVMACGDKLRRNHGNPWRDRLDQLHHYRCEELFTPELVT